MTPLERGRCGIFVAVSLLSACAASGPPAPVDPLAPDELSRPLDRLAPQFVAGRACAPLAAYVAPPAGTRFEYRRPDGSRSTRTITASRGDEVEFAFQVAGAEHALPPRAVLAGFMLARSGPESGRGLEYERNPVDVLRTLQPGQVATIPTAETSTLAGRRLTLSLPTLVRYEACGDVMVAGQTHPVRVYRVSRGRRVLDRATGTDRVLRSQATYYLSATAGFPLIFQDQAITVADRIVPPAAG
jgi:hypothetical protein